MAVVKEDVQERGEMEALKSETQRQRRRATFVIKMETTKTMTFLKKV